MLIALFFEWVIMNYYKYDLILEGDRITNTKVMDFLLKMNYEVKIIYLDTDIDTCIKRLPYKKEIHIRSTLTKCRNIWDMYKDKFDVKKYIN